MKNDPRKNSFDSSTGLKTGGISRRTFLAHRKPQYERLYGLMGETLLLQTNNLRILAAADDAFGRFPVPEASDERDPLLIQLFVQERAQAVNGHPSTLIHHTQGHLLTIQSGYTNLAVADLRAGYAIGFLSDELAAQVEYIRYHIIEALSLAMLGLARSYFVVHAACVVKNGTSLLLHGQAGAGKSTLAYACIRRGYRLLAEDAVQVKTNPSGPQLWGAPWKFHLLPDAVSLFPELHDRHVSLQMNGEQKIEIDLEAMYPGSTVTCAEPGPVIFLNRSKDRPTGLEPVTMEQARREFEIIWSWDHGWNDKLEVASQRLLDCGVYRLTTNGSPDEAVDHFDRLLETLQ